MNLLTLLAERRISQAIEDGSLDFARWKNMPLPEDDDTQVPDDLKIAYKMLKNAGYLPPEIEARKEISNLEEMISRTEDEHVRLKQMKKLNVLLMKLETSRQSPTNLASQDHYFQKIVERISVNCRKGGR